MSLSTPHGGALINREVRGDTHAALVHASAGMPELTLNAREQSDVELLGNGAYSPLTGFLGEADYVSVRDERRLANGLVWTLPITLSVNAAQRTKLQRGDDLALRDATGALLAVLHLTEIYAYDKRLEAARVYRTTDARHPGVQALYAQGEFLLGGQVSVLGLPQWFDFAPYRYRPQELRQVFLARGWQRIVAFQTRNPVHRAHEYIQKCALETVDGLLLHPLVGETQAGDIPAQVRLLAYEALLANYFPSERVQLAVLPAAMRYAGPREAIFHALIRKNYGATHFIVGRDHAGVGAYYGTYDAQRIFDDFAAEELGITPLFFDNTFFCRRCTGIASQKTCPHKPEEHVSLSGTQVRELLLRGQLPPPEVTRPEVAQVLLKAQQR